MLDAVLNILFFIGMIVWFGGGVAFFLYGRKAHSAYLRRFPPVDRYLTLDLYVSGNPFDPVRRRIRQLVREPQEDPELEQLRRELRRRIRLMFLWIYGFPTVTVIVIGLAVALLVETGIVHLN